jgi:hypothetical protein
MTKGPCMLGKLNYYLGYRASGEGRSALYPDIDFCKHSMILTPSIFVYKLSANNNFVMTQVTPQT